MNHKCDFALIQCIDFRFRAMTEKFSVDLFQTSDFDLYSWPGAAKKLADDDTRSAAMRDIDICIGLHSTEKIAIVSHMDCGAYGGSKAFASPDEEKKVLTRDLHTARDLILEKHPNVKVETYLLDPNEEDQFLSV